jgi:hypothetical protein
MDIPAFNQLPQGGNAGTAFRRCEHPFCIRKFAGAVEERFVRYCDGGSTRRAHGIQDEKISQRAWHA